MPLKHYQQKRNFNKSPEPKGKKPIPKTHSLLYVIQKHQARHLHYDLRLEMHGVLKSWAVPKGPCLDPTVKRLAVHVEDHPIEYGSFEGIIPDAEYGGGTVMLWDQGTWEEESENGYEKGDLTFIIKGSRLKGAWKLVQMKKSPKNWLLMKLKDKAARALDEYDITEDKQRSVVSRRTMEGIKKSG